MSSKEAPTAVAPAKASSSNESGNSATTSKDDETSYTRRSTLFSSPSCYSLKEGEFMHDYREGDKTLVKYVKHVGTMNVFDIFLDYTRVISQDHKQPAEAFNQNESMNRYRDIRCIDATRVRLEAQSDGNDYIHANYVDGFREEKKFILTQAPLGSTVDKFWDMIWQEKSTMIISLTVLDGEKVSPYVPINRGQSAKFGNIEVMNMGTRHISNSYDATILLINKGEEPKRKLLHISFYAWPDKGTPSRPTELLYLLDDMNYNRHILMAEAKKKGWLSETARSPIVIHCLAGVGRSGALAALDICQRKLDYTQNHDCGPCVDVRDTVLRIRTQREMAVQKPEQYLYLHLAILEYAIRKRYFENIHIVDVSQFLIKPKK